MIRHRNEMKVEVRERMRDGEGAVTVRHLFKPDEIHVKTRLCAHLTLPVGASIGLHAHEAEDELYYILEGRGVVEEDGTVTEVGKGDAVMTGLGASHSVRNTGDEPLEILAMVMCYP